ncbi:MAG: RNA polymerase sigma-70 factor [Dysgonamonadaceae bacterium]|jgi:RNA polymerase sigma-70 factor (ECF subfamily)|nr:RNA polymerase sigma-70 factor [Dysgonamonadaceae bacterium]
MISSENTKFLLRKIAAGDSDAFRSFYDYYYSQIYRFSSYFVKSPQVVEEIVSDVFCTIWQHRKKITEIDNFEGYLYTITKNRALYYLRQDNRILLTDLDLDLISDEILSHDENPEMLVIDNEFSAAFKNAVDELPEKCRLIFLLAREEGLKYKEIAEKLSISEKTVNAQMVLAIKKLTARLGKILFFII